MTAAFVYPEVGAMHLAGVVKADLANAKIRLFKTPGPTLDSGTTVASLIADEADFDGYAAAVVAAWVGPYQDPAGGASIRSGEQDFAYTPAVPPVTSTNSIGGFWVETAAGVLLAVVGFEQPVNVGVDNVIFPLTAVLNYGRTE